MEKNRRIEVAHSHEEFSYKLETLRTAGFPDHEIHIFSKDLDRYEEFKRDSDFNTHEAGNWFDKFKAFFSGEDAVTEALHQLDLSEEERLRLSDELYHGATIIYAENITAAGQPSDDVFGQQSEYELEQQADQEARSQLEDLDLLRRRM